jgi:hypothetical protein
MIGVLVLKKPAAPKRDREKEKEKRFDLETTSIESCPNIQDSVQEKVNVLNLRQGLGLQRESCFSFPMATGVRFSLPPDAASFAINHPPQGHLFRQTLHNQESHVLRTF